MDEEQKQRVQEIVDGMQCPRAFRCCRDNFANVCKAKDIGGIEAFLECLEENPQDCKFSVSFGFSHFCQCPLRVYIAKKLKK